MKKFFSYLGWTLLLAVIIAAFTSTGKEQCTKYVKEKISPEPFINLTVSEAPFKFLGAKIFAIYTVSYFKLRTLNLPQNGSTTNSPALAAIIANSGQQQETYIGLYNTFWKW